MKDDIYSEAQFSVEFDQNKYFDVAKNLRYKITPIDVAKFFVLNFASEELILFWQLFVGNKLRLIKAH